MELGYNGYTTKYATLKQDIIEAAKCGFQSIELRDFKLEDYLIENSLESLNDLLKRNKIKVSSINALEICQNSDSGYKFENIKNKLIWMCEMGDAVGADSLVTAPLFNDNNCSYEENKKYLVELYRCLSDIASNYKVKIGFEIISLTGAMVPNLKSAIEIIKEIDRENVGLCFDCFAFYGNDSKIETIKEIPVEKLYMVHINDARKGVNKQEIAEKDRRFPGEGEIPLEDIIAEIKGIGYNGTFSLELITPQIWEWETARAVKHSYETSLKLLSKYYTVC